MASGTQNTFKSGDLRSKLIIHAFETDHIPDFGNTKFIKTNCINYHNRIFHEGWFTKMHISALIEDTATLNEYAALL